MKQDAAAAVDYAGQGEAEGAWGARFRDEVAGEAEDELERLRRISEGSPLHRFCEEAALVVDEGDGRLRAAEVDCEDGIHDIVLPQARL